MADLTVTGEVVVTSENAEAAFERVNNKATQMANEVAASAGKAGQAVDKIGDGAGASAEKFTRAESRMRDAIMKSTRELEMLGKTASQKFEAQLEFKGLEKAKFQEAISGLQAMESALSVAKAREAEFAAQNAFSLKAAQAKELVKASEYARWWAQELEKVEAAEKRLAGQNSFIASLKSQADAIGKTKAELLEMQAAQMGVATQAAPFIAKMREAEAGVGKMEAATKRAEAGFSSMGTAVQMAGRALAAIGIGASVREFVTMADASTNVASRLGLVTSSAAELANVQQRLFGIAQSSRVSFTDLVGTYAQVARSTKDLGVSQTALLGVIQTISQAVTISGGSAASAQAALVQLSQGFAAGALRGEELNSVLEQTPRLAQAIADGLGVGIGKLREMGSNGELTAEKVLGALQKAAAGIESEFARMTPTIEQSLTKITNSMTRLVGEIDKGVGATSKLSSALGLVSGGIDFLAGDISKLNSQGALRAAADEVLRLDGMAKRLRNTMDSGIVGPNAQANLDALMAKLAEAKARFRELDAQLGGVRDPRDQSGFTGRGASYANEAARQAKLRDDANAFRLNQAGVPASYLKDMAELIRLNQAGVIVGKEYTDALKKQQDELLKKTGAVKSSNAAANQEQNAYESLIASIRAKIEADNLEIAGGAALTESQRIRIKLDQDLAAGRVKLTAQNERAVRLALEELAASEASALAAKTLAKANLAAAASREKYLTSLSTGLDKIKADTAAQLEATARLGLSKEAIAELDAAKLEMLATDLELQAIKAMDRNLDEQTYSALKQQAEAYRELAAAKKAGATKEMALDLEKVNKEAAKKAADEWQRAADDINRSLTDALMRGFESGKDFAENLRDTVKNMFSTLVLRPVISAVMSPVAGAINGMLYGNAAAAAGGGASALGMLGSGANLITGLQGTQGMLGTVGGWLGLNTVATNAGLAATIGIDAASAAAAANAAGAAGGGLLSGVGAALPWIGGIAAVASILGGLDDSGTYHTGGAAQYSAATGLRTSLGFRDNEEGLPSYNPNDNIDNQFGTGFGYVVRGDQTIDVVSNLARGLGTALDGIAVAFGEKAGYSVATAFADDTSKDGAWGALRISKDGQDLLNWENNRQSRWAPKEFGDGEAGYKEYLAAVAKDTRQVLLDMDLPSWADDMLESIGDSASMEQLTGVLTQIGVVQSAFVALGRSMEMFAGLSEDMQSGLLKESGSIDALTSNAGAFYQGFFSEAERVDALTAQLNSSLSNFDLSIDPTTGEAAKAQFRAAVEGAFAAGNAEMASGLLALSSSFSMAADYFAQPAKERAAQEASTLANLAKDQAALWADLAEAQGDMATAAQRRYLLETQGMTQAEEAAYKYNAELRKQVSAAQQAASAISGLLTDRFDLENQLLTQAGQDDLVQQRIDQRDLAELTKGLPEEQAAKVREQFEANLKLRDQYAANQLAADNLAKAMEEMERQQNAAAQAQRSMLQGTVTSAQNAVTQLKSIFDTLDSSIASLRGSVASAAEQDSRAAREYIAQASVLMRSGSVVDAGRLQAAVRSATAGIDNQQFANSNEADFERLKLAGELAGLKDSTAGQLTVAEQHLSIAESQLAALEYIASSISSLAGAQQAAAGQPRDQWATVSGQQVYASSGGAVGLNTGSGIDIYGKDGSRFTDGEAIAYVRNQIAANDEASVYAEAVRTGISSKALDELMGWAAGTSNDWAKANKLPQFAVGTNYVPRDMVAQIHEGEAIVPKAFNPWANGSKGSDNTELIAELRALRAEVAELRNAAEETAGATGATADVLVRVTQNGNGMVTAAAPI